jgi:hypothetical protein
MGTSLVGLEADMSKIIRVITALAALSLVSGAAMAEEHIPGPEESSSPSQLLASSSDGPTLRVVKQRQARTTYRGVWGASVEDERYLGRDIPLDLAAVSRSDGGELSLEITLWDTPSVIEPEAVVVYFAKPGDMAPRWAAYQATPRDGGAPDAWALYRYDQSTGLYDQRVGDATLTRQGDTLQVSAQRIDSMPRTVVAFVETYSSDDEDWAWKDRAPGRRTGLRMR